MIRYALLTHDFRVPCSDGHGIFLGRLGALETLESVLCLGQRGDGWNLLSAPPRTLWYDFLSNRHNRAVAAGCIDIETTHESGLVRLRERQRYLRVFAEGEIKAVEIPADERGDRSLFRLIPWSELETLWHVIRQKWVLGPKGTLATVNEWESTFRTIRFGALRVPFDRFLTAICRRPSSDEFIFLAEKNLYRAAYYRPALLYVVFGEKVLREFQAALDSVADPGGYSGEVLVATDLQPGQIERAVPRALRSRYRVLPMSAFDYPDYISTRQTLFSSGVLDAYAPLLYMDGDVAVNVPLDPILQAGALERRMSAQIENFNGDFRHSASNGQVLYSRDPYPVEQAEAGFNTGVFLVPNVKQQRCFLDPAFYTNLIYTDQHGRGSIPFHEQSVMNYALRKIEAFDCRFINDITDVGGERGSPIVQEYGSMNPARARGFVHFWCCGGSNRSLPMGSYTRQIRRYRRRKGL